MSKSKRFKAVEGQGIFSPIKIMVDNHTGVNYLIAQSDTGVGITPLLGRDGKVVITAVSDEDSKDL